MRFISLKILAGLYLTTTASSLLAQQNSAFCDKVAKEYKLEAFFSTPQHVCQCPSSDIQTEYDLLLCLRFFDVIYSDVNGAAVVPQGMPDNIYLPSTLGFKPPRRPKLPKIPKDPKPLPPKPDEGGKKG